MVHPTKAEGTKVRDGKRKKVRDEKRKKMRDGKRKKVRDRMRKKVRDGKRKKVCQIESEKDEASKKDEEQIKIQCYCRR